MQTLTEKPHTQIHTYTYIQKREHNKSLNSDSSLASSFKPLCLFMTHTAQLSCFPSCTIPSSTTRIRKCSSWSSSNRLGSPSISHHRAALSLCGSFSALFRTHMLTYLHAHVVSPVIFLVCAYNCQRAEFVGPVKSQAGWSSPDLSLHVRNK